MTLEEKLGQLNQLPAIGSPTGPTASREGLAGVRTGRVGSFLGIFGAEYTRDLQRIAVEESRLKIPLLFAWDVIHGFRTTFPVPLAEAAAFDPELAERSARIAAIEATANGLHWTFAPMVDIARDPRWGRVVEGAGEDPYLGSMMAAARVRGFQGGDRVTSFSGPSALIATAKHFAAYGGAEGGRDYNTSELSERTFWEIYLPPFQAAVRAGVGTIMASFQDIGGTPAHASDWLLTDVLRTRWGFPGLVISDWAGIEELIAHGVAGTKGEAGVKAINAGIDVDMSDAVYVDSLAQAVRDGRLKESVVDSAVARVIRLKQAMGLFSDPYRYSNVNRQRDLTYRPEHVAAARAAARASIVLLKNDGSTLPLLKGLRTIAVIGPMADDAQSMLGSWAADGRPENVVTLLAGIRSAVGTATRIIHVRGSPVDTIDRRGFAAAMRAAAEADAIVLALGERADMSGEARSRVSIELPGAQLELARAVMRAAAGDTRRPRKPVVAVLMNGRPLALTGLSETVPAIVESWFLGVQHGVAVAEVLFGDANPGGKLPISFPRATGQIPVYYNHKNTGRPADSTEIYRSTYMDMRATPLYPFGHGLSYTSFVYDSLRLSRTTMGASDTLSVSVSVTNTGSRAGDEVVQLYIRDDVASVSRPVRELKGFQRITLRAGDVRRVTFRIGAEELAFYDAGMRRVVEPGAFTVFVGGSSDARMSARFAVARDTLVVENAPARLR